MFTNVLKDVYLNSHSTPPTQLGVCLPFIVSNAKTHGWLFSVFLFLVINLIAFIIIFIGLVKRTRILDNNYSTYITLQ